MWHSLPEGSVPSTCPFCSCGCGLTLFHDTAHVAGTSPSLRHPVSQGRLCARGWAAHEPSSWGPRLLEPALRDPQGLRSAAWEDALDRAARELGTLLDAGRSVGVLVSGRSTNEECYLAVKLARGALGTGNVDALLRLPYQALLRGLETQGEAQSLCGALHRLEESGRILLVEGDLATTHPHVAFSVIRAVRRGARLVTLGTSRTQMSRLAAVHLPLDLPSPHHLPPGLEEAVGGRMDPAGRGLSVVLAPFTPDLKALSRTAEALAQALRVKDGGNGPGPCFLPLPHRANTRGALEAGAVPGHLPGLRSLSDIGARDRVLLAWGRDPALEEGLDAERMAAQVQGLVVVREHPVASVLHPSAVLTALGKLESLVVLDAYRSPTTAAATVVLPLAALAEEEGTLTSLEGRVQRLRKAASPPGLARPGWQVLSDLLARLGMEAGHDSVVDVFREMGSVIPEYGALTWEMTGEPGGGWVSIRTPGGRGAEDLSQGQGPEGREAPFGTHWLALEGCFDWEEDLLVEVSPTLRRDGASRRKLYPRGMVAMNPSDGQALGIRAGWPVRLRSPAGEAVVPVALSPRVEAGTLLAPFGFREALADVLGDRGVERVEVERT